jgi:hypothetical protein
MLLEEGKRYITSNGIMTSALRKEGSIFFGKVDNEEVIWNERGQASHDPIVNIVRELLTPSLPEKEKAGTDKVETGLTMIPFYSILRIGGIFVEGLRYGRDNWKKGVNDKEYQEERLEHAMLHLIKWKEGDRSEDHLAKVAWFCVTQLELERLEDASR